MKIFCTREEKGGELALTEDWKGVGKIKTEKSNWGSRWHSRKSIHSKAVREPNTLSTSQDWRPGWDPNTKALTTLAIKNRNPGSFSSLVILESFTTKCQVLSSLLHSNLIQKWLEQFARWTAIDCSEWSKGRIRRLSTGTDVYGGDSSALLNWWSCLQSPNMLLYFTYSDTFTVHLIISGVFLKIFSILFNIFLLLFAENIWPKHILKLWEIQIIKGS